VTSRDNLHVRLSAELHDRLRAAATERALGLNFLCVHLLSEGLDRLIPVEDLRLTRPRPEQAMAAAVDAYGPPTSPPQDPGT
jgi:hypothetical protein